MRDRAAGWFRDGDASPVSVSPRIHDYRQVRFWRERAEAAEKRAELAEKREAERERAAELRESALNETISELLDGLVS